MNSTQAQALNRTFLLSVGRWIASTKENTDLVVRKTLFGMSAKIVERSPVDTGRFRANWQFGEDVMPRGATGDTDVSVPGGQPGSSTEKKFEMEMRDLHAGHIHYLVNNLPYAVVLEYGLYPNPPKVGSKKRGEDSPAVHVSGGYSIQSPYGMVRVTMVEFKQVFDAAVASTRRGNKSVQP